MNSSSKELMVGEKPLSSLRVVDLKEELEKRGLSKSGSKKDLADRLKNFLLAEKQKELPVPAADEEQLPNISMQEKLAEQNPFIRDYFASQAELFHSQKVAKKLLEEEARRESETSAPSADEESSAAEDKSPIKETEVQKGKVKRLARRFENQGRGNKVEEPASVDMTVDKPSIEEMPEISIGKPVEIDSEPSAKQTNLKITEDEPIAKKTEPELVPSESTSEKPEDKENIMKDTESCNDNEVSGVDLTVRVSKEDSQIKDDTMNDTNDDSSSVSSSSPDPVPKQLEVKSPEPSSAKSLQKVAPVVDASSEAKQPEESARLRDSTVKTPVVSGDSEISKNGNVRKLAEKFEAPSVSRELDNVEDEKAIEKLDEVPEERAQTPVETKSTLPEEQDDDADSESSESSRSRSPKAQRARSSTHSSPAQKVSSPEDGHQKKKLTESFDKKSDDASRDEELEISMEVDDQIEMGPTRNGETDKLKKITPVKKQETIIRIKSKNEDEARSIQRKVVEPSDDEEALDYGEEEKLKIEPARFTWAKRILRLKNKHEPKEHSGKRWKMPEDMNSPIINTEYLMQWFPEVELAPDSEFKLEDREKTPPTSSNTDKDFENIEITRKISIDSVEPNQTSIENITITRKVSLIPMVPGATADDLEKELSPPRHPPSELILITNLTRPFTLPQLKELLQRTGNLLDVWVDKIKSRCIAKYEKQEEAFETRAALHGVNWPQSNPKTLSVDYTTQERLDDYQARDAGVDVKPVRIDKPVTADNIMPVREWDMGKRGKSRSPQRVRKSSRSASRERKRPRRSQSPGLNRRRHSRSPHHDRRSRGDAKDAEPLGKALDELFRKTIATPSIYWLPLTPQQISEKEELRRKRMIERERRLAEMSKMRPR